MPEEQRGPTRFSADVGGGGIDAALVTFSPAVVADWDGEVDPGNADDAFDQLADRVGMLEDAAALGEIYLTGAGGWPSTTSGASDPTRVEYDTNDVDLYHMDFDRATPEYAQWTVWMPMDWDGLTVTYRVAWTAAAGSAAETVEWNLQGRSYADDEAIDQGWGAAVEVSDALIATGDVHISAESAAVTLAGTPAGGEIAQFRLWRDAAADSLDADARLIGVKVYYRRV